MLGMEGSRGVSRTTGGAHGLQRLEATLKFLESSTSNRVDGLDGVREALAVNGSFPPPGPLRQRLLAAASACATDPNSRVSLKWLQFLQETATAHAAEIDEELPALIAACVEALGAPSSACRQTAVQVLCACGKSPDPGPQALLCGVTEGTRHATSRVRAESCSAVLTVLDSAHLRGRNMQVVEEVVAPALLERLMDSTPSVVEAAEAALVSLRSSHGEALTAALLDASVPVQRLYQQRLGADEDCQRSGAAPARRWDVPGGDDAGSSEFVSARLLAELQDPNNWRVRALAVEELQAMVRAVRGPEDLRTHLLQLVELLVGLVQDTNFKIQITALQTLGYMVSIMGPEVGPLLPRVLPELLDKLGDNKTLVRHASSRAVLRLMGAVGPQPVVAELVPVLGHDAWHTREEALSLCMLAMLRFRDASFDAETLARSVRGCLEDSKPKVKQTAVECLALLNARGGKVLLLLTDLDEATRRMLEARFAQPQLASMTAEGSLEMPALSQLLEEETAPRGMLGSVPAILEGWTNVGLGPVTQAPGGGASPDYRRQPRDEEQPGAASPIGGRGRTAGRRRPDLHVADDSDGPVRTGGVDGAVDGTADGVVRSGAGYSAAMSQASTQHHASPGRTPHEPPREAAGGALHAHVAVGNNGLGDEMLEDDQPLYRETPLDTPPSPLAVGAAASGFRGGSPLAGKTPRRMRGGAESASLGAGGVLVGTGGGMGEIAGGARGPIKPFWMDGLDQPPAPDTQGAYGGGGGRGLALDDGGETRGARAAPAGRRAGAMQGRAAAVQRGQGHTGGAYEDIFGSSGPFARTGSSEEETGGRPLWSAKELSSSQFQSLPGAQVEESPPRSPRGDANLPVLAYTISAPLPEADPSERPGSDQLSRSLRSREDNIASRLSILKSRSTGIRGRTGSGRRVVSASAAFGATDQSSAGLGATTPVDPLQREPDLEDGPSSPVQRGLSERFTMRPSLSAPTNPHTAHGTSRRERGGDSYHRRGAPAPTHMGAGSSDEEDSGQRREVRSAMDAGARPSGGYTEPVHTPTEELQPVENPDTTMRTLIERLGSSDWAVQMEALNDLRALSIYHAPQTVLPNLHQVVRHTLLVADNLRSQLSKAAIMSLADMLRYLKAHMDPELDKLVITLVKKAGETSGFIAEEAKKAMLAAIDNCSEHRTISALLHANVNKNSIIRGKVALFLQVAIENLGNRVVASRELERLFPVIVRYLSEGQMEPRAAGKKALLDIHRHTKASGEFERLLRRCPASDVKVVDKVIAQEAANNDAWTVRPGTLQTGRADLTTTLGSSSRSLSRHSGTLGQGKEATRTAEVIGDFGSSTSTRRAFEGGAEDLVVGSGQLGSRGARRIRTGGGDGKGMSAQSWQSLLDAPGFERLGDITHAAEKGDFRARADAVHDLTQLLIAQRQACAPRLGAFVDIYASRLADANTKVATAALQGIEQLVPAFGPQALELSLGILVPALAGNLSNSSLQIRNLAAANLEQLSSIMDPVVLLPPLTSALDFGNPRARSALAERLRALLPGISERKPQLLHKHAVPSTLRLLEDHRADVRAATASLVRDLHLALGGDGLLAAPRLTDRQKQRVRDIISSA